MKKIYVLLIGMVTLFFADKSYGQDDSENRKWVVSMIKSHIENLNEMSTPVVFKDDFKGNQKFRYDVLEQNFTNERPVAHTVSGEVVGELQELIKNRLQLNFRSGYPNSVISVNDIHIMINDLLNITDMKFKNTAFFSMKFYPKSVTFMNKSQCVDATCFVSNRLLLDKYGEIGDDGLLWFEEDKSKLSKLEKEVWNDENSFYDGIVVKSSKPIKRLDYEVHVPIPSTKILKISKEEPVASTRYGDFKLKRLDGDRVRLEVPTYLYWTIDIYGVHKDGGMLKEIDREKTNTYTDQQMVNFRKWATVYEELLKEVNANPQLNSAKITNKISDIQSKKSEDPHKPLIVSYEIEFSGPLDHIQIKVYGVLDEPKVFPFTKEFNYKDNEFFLGTDNTTHKVGVLGVDGQWIVKPTFSSEMTQYKKFFYYDYVRSKGKNENYWLDRKNKQLKKLVYDHSNDIIYADRYSIMTKDSYKPQGVMDVISGEMVLPVKYDYIRFEEDRWKAALDEQEYYFTLDGKPINDDSEK